MARPRSKFGPQTPAERQAKCRAIKRGTWHCYEGTPCLPSPPGRNLVGPPAGLHAPTATAKATPALPAPPITAIWKTLATSDTALALPDDGAPDAAAPGDALRLSLPPAVAARLRSLLARQDAGKSLTAAQRAEAQGLLDIAEYFVVQRLRRRLAA